MATQLLKAFRATLKPVSQKPPSENVGRGVTTLVKTAAQQTPKTKARPRVQPAPRRYRHRYRFAPA